MAHIFERPGRTRRAHPGILFIKDYRLASGKAERGKNPRELIVEIAEARLACVTMMERKGIEVPCAFEMTAPVIRGRTRVDEYDVTIAAMGPQPIRIDQILGLCLIRHDDFTLPFAIASPDSV